MITLGKGLHAEGHRVIEKGLKILCAHNPSPSESRAIGDVGSGETSGMGRSGFGASLSDSDLENNDRFDGGGFLRDPEEFITLLDAFEVTRNDVGLLVFSEG